jgi:anti-anti-sigma factor
MNDMRQLELKRTKEGRVCLIVVSGRLTASGGDLTFHQAIGDAIGEGERQFVIDFEHLQTLDSSGLGELMGASFVVRKVGGNMAWAACPRTMLDLLKITSVEPAGVTFHDSADEAVKALS